MPKFSDRMGITKPPAEIQVESMNRELRNSLWNLIVEAFSREWSIPVKKLFKSWFKLPVDNVPFDEYDCKEWLKAQFMNMSWYDAYNFIEHVLVNVEYLTLNEMRGRALYRQPNFEEGLNFLLERELSGYRAINGEIVPIIDQSEVEAIRRATDSTSSLGLEGPRQHILKALHLLGKKPEPDYRNSIKESISAVEGICKLLTDEKSGGIKVALEKLSSKVHLHESFKKSLLSLYGYTSDEAGIRHPILEEKDVGFAEAKFMLVTCSAFANFLIDKARQAGIL